MKTKYKGTFNWHGETHIFFRWAQDRDDAWRVFTRALARKLRKCCITSVRREFRGKKSNYKIEEVKDD